MSSENSDDKNYIFTLNVKVASFYDFSVKSSSINEQITWDHANFWIKCSFYGLFIDPLQLDLLILVPFTWKDIM